MSAGVAVTSTHFPHGYHLSHCPRVNKFCTQTHTVTKNSTWTNSLSARAHISSLSFIVKALCLVVFSQSALLFPCSVRLPGLQLMHLCLCAFLCHLHSPSSPPPCLSVCLSICLSPLLSVSHSTPLTAVRMNFPVCVCLCVCSESPLPSVSDPLRQTQT